MTTAATTTKKSSAPVAEITAPAPAPATGFANGFSVAALVLAISGIVLGQGWLSVGAIIFGFVGRAKEPAARLTANWGLVLGFVGVFGGFLLALIGFAAFVPLWAAGAVWGF